MRASERFEMGVSGRKGRMRETPDSMASGYWMGMGVGDWGLKMFPDLFEAFSSRRNRLEDGGSQDLLKDRGPDLHATTLGFIPHVENDRERKIHLRELEGDEESRDGGSLHP